MPLIHKSDGKNGVEAGTFLKLSWSVIIGIVVTISIAVFGIVNAANISAHEDLNMKIEKMVEVVKVLSTVVSGNCSDIAVLKSESTSTKHMLSKLDDKLDNISRDQLEFYLKSGFKPKSR